MLKLFFRLGIVVLFVLAAGCQNKITKTTGVEKEWEAENYTLDQQLKEIKSFLKLAENAVQYQDSLGADFYYNEALERVEELESRHVQDSVFIEIKDKVFHSYHEFIGKIEDPMPDTLSAADVIEDLELNGDSLESANDTTTVSITDVIDENQIMKIPMTINRQVENAIKYFNTRGRKIFTVWLKRASRYENLIKSILREEEVPEELFYLAMIESGFNPHARSYARAVGIWQFISATGKAYGLRNSWWFDERRDPVKATRAAARHLKDLYARFGDWYIAMAGYNFSPHKIEYRIERYGVSSYWDLPRLPRQTRNYIPSFLAAATIAQNPEEYGFYVEPNIPVTFDTVTVRECVDLNVVARCIDKSFSEIKNLNPALLRWCTPPDVDEWVLYLPEGTREKFLENYSQIPESEKVSWTHHRIRSGETLSTIARRYRVSVNEIKRFNNIRGTLIRAGASLVIPVPQNKQYYNKYAHLASDNTAPVRQKPVSNVPGREKVVYRVKKGDTLWEIAQQFEISLNQLREWNGLGYTRIIKPGQSLNIWLVKENIPPSMLAQNEQDNSGTETVTAVPGADNYIVHVVREGDTLWDIASQYNVSISQIKKWNGMRSNQIWPNDKLKIYRE